MDEKIVASITVNYTDGSQEEILDSSVILSLDLEGREITIRASQELSNEAVVIICEESARNLEMIISEPPIGRLQ